MSMINCPNCGEIISNKANKCVHCGFALKQDEQVIMHKYCAECGAELSANAVECDKCGCPVEEKSVLTGTAIESEIVKTKKSSKKAIVITCIALILIVASVFSFLKVSKIRAEKEAQVAAESAAEESSRISSEYSSNLKSITNMMIFGAADAEDCGNLTLKVWYNCIFEKSDSETDEYTKSKFGYFYDDFNDALVNLYADEDFISKLTAIQENHDSVAKKMKDLKNPPSEWEEAYNAVSDLYDAYIELTNLALDPSGSYDTFSSNFATADKNVSNAYSKMEQYLE